jgi:predicted Zn-dependent protease
MVPSIELEQYYWDRSSFNVLVEANQWSTHEYIIAVREALDAWVTSCWKFNHSYLNATWSINYDFFMTNTNSTDDHDIFVVFVPDQVDSTNQIIGKTQGRWNSVTNNPIPPITIYITTYSATVDKLFVKNVAMHELGHAFGLGHTVFQWASIGPELMHTSVATSSIIYPSTLDVYGLLLLFQGYNNQTIHLPANIPYTVLIDDINAHPFQTFAPNVLYPSSIVFILGISVGIGSIITKQSRKLRKRAHHST